MKSLVIYLCCAAATVGFTWAMPASEPDASGHPVLNTVINTVNDCIRQDVSLCLKEKAMNFAEGLVAKREVPLVDFITLIGTGSPRSGRALEPLPEEPKARESQIESRLFDIASDFLENHVIQFRLPSSTVEDVKRSLEEGRKKKLKKLMPLLALLQLKVSALIPLFLGIIAFVALKGLFLGKIAVLVTIASILKSLLSSKNQATSYEVVAHPHHEDYHTSSSSSTGQHGWGRSTEEGQNLAYSAYAKSQGNNNYV